jgi:hypothetical protein
MHSSPLKICPKCKKDVLKDFDLCNYCGFLFPKSVWRTYKNTIAITSLATTTAVLGAVLLFRPPAPGQPANPVPTPISTATATITPSVSPSTAQEKTPKPVQTVIIESRLPIPTPPPKSTPEEKADELIKGNRNSRIYHWPGCPNYDDISARNTVWFSTRSEAEAAGYRAAKNCP